MYETYWRLKQKPFENAADPRFYYPGESHQAALLKLRYAVENRRGAALLAGPSGAGKTLLTTMLRGMLGEHSPPSSTWCFRRCPTAELLAYLADELDGDRMRPARTRRRAGRASAGSSGSWPPTPSRAGTRWWPSTRPTSSATRHTFEALRLLLNFEPGGTPALTLLLVGQPAILPAFDRMPQWEERLGVKCLLRPFSQAGDGSLRRASAAGGRLAAARSSSPTPCPRSRN